MSPSLDGQHSQLKPRSELLAELMRHSPAFKTVAWYAIAAGVIGSASWLYTMQVYDRVVTTRSVTTLMTLTGLVLFAYVMLEVIEWVRNEILRAVAREIEDRLSLRVFDAVFRGALLRHPKVSPNTLQDFKTLTQFMYSPNMGLLVDMPVALLNLAIIMLINPIMGAWSLVGAGIQSYITFRSQQASMKGMKDAQQESMAANRYAMLALQNAEAFEAMGMTAQVRAVWHEKQAKYLHLLGEASTSAGQKSALSKTMMMAQSSLILGLGCYLTIKGVLGGEKSAIGAPGPVLMLIASILGGRGIGPLVQLITQWQIIPMTVRAYQQVDAALKAIPPQASALSLPEPTGRLSIERLYAKPPGSDAMTLKGIQAEIPAGASMAVIGPSAAGKSSLAKCLVGVWEPDGGSVRLDGANLHRWPKEQLGRFVGYLPQDVELFEGSLGDNISRFEAASAERDAALEVAIRIAGLSDLVKQLPKGLETALGPDGQFFSGGQRQRVGLARAIYGMPKLVVMDEPDAHLDEAGDRALAEAIVALRAQRCSVVVITHRKELLALMDSVLVIHDGQLAAFGPRDQVLKAIEGARKPLLQEASQA